MQIFTTSLALRFSILAAACAPALAQAQLYRSVGPAAGEHLGSSVSGAGDLNGDGASDFLIGAAFSSIGAPVAGQVQAFSGRTGALLHAFAGTIAGEYVGWSCSAAGDFNHDSVADLAIGAFGVAPSGEVRVYSGLTGALLHTRVGGPSEAIGRALAGADLNGDGFGDVIIGASSLNGNVRVITGSPAYLMGVLYNWSGVAASDMFGRAVAITGDMDGDGKPDVVVGAPGNDTNGSGSGMVRAFSGRTGTTPLIWSWYGDFAADSLGESVAGAGDVDGDGAADVIAGAPYYAVGGAFRGYARIYSGRTGAIIRTLYGAPDWYYFGTGVASLGDLDGDGKAEGAVSCTSADSAPHTYGAVRVFSGATGAAIFTISGETYDAFGFGISLANVGDLNGDGRGDLIVGASQDSVYTGSARVFLSACAAPLVYCSGKINSLGCPPAIAHSGAPSVSVGNNFAVSATNVRNRKPGILLWGLGSAAIPFGGGTLCIAPPVTRTPGQDSGGTPVPASDCSGSYSFAFTHAYMASKGMLPGTGAYAQYWSRDPGYAPPNNIGLTNAVSFVVCP